MPLVEFHRDGGEFFGFSAPKGVERACPMQAEMRTCEFMLFQCPEGR